MSKKKAPLEFQRNTKLEKKLKNDEHVVITRKDWTKLMLHREDYKILSKDETVSRLIDKTNSLRIHNADLRRRLQSSSKLRKEKKVLRKYSKQAMKKRWDEVVQYGFKTRLALAFSILGKGKLSLEFLWKFGLILALLSPWGLLIWRLL